MTYLVVPNWQKFQHYKDRNPVWIKNHLELLWKDEYRALTLHQRGVLHGLWMLYAATHRQLSDSTLTTTRQLGQRVATRDLASLSDAGFVLLGASNPLAARYQDARADKEKEELRSGPYLGEKEDPDRTDESVAWQGDLEHLLPDLRRLQ